MKRQKAQISALVDRLLDGPEGGSDSEEQRKHAQRWRHLNERVRSTRERKKATAALFNKSDAGSDRETLVAQMKEISAALKHDEADLKEIEHALMDWANSSEDSGDRPGLPAHLSWRPRHGAPPEILVFEELNAGNRPDWDRFFKQQPNSTLCHDSRWLEVIETVMKQRSISLLARRADGRVVGILPLYRLSSRLFGDFGVSVPYLNYGGALADFVEIEDALMQEAVRRATDLGMQHLEFRDRAHRPEWNSRMDKVSMILSLPESPDALDDQIGSKVRAQIRRARKENVMVERGSSARELDAFYKVFARNMRDLGTPVYSRELFRRILSLWGEDAALLVLRLGGKPVAGAFLIRHRETLEIPWASTVRAVNPLGINMLMYWEALNRAIDQGCRFFDFGRSTRDSGTFRFKQQWGAVPVAHHWHYWVRDGVEPPSLTPASPRYRLAVKVWQRLPVTLTRLIGPRIVRNLP